MWSRSSGTACWTMSWVPAAASVLRLLKCSVDGGLKRLEAIYTASDRDGRATLAAWLSWAELRLDDGDFGSIQLMHKHGT